MTEPSQPTASSPPSRRVLTRPLVLLCIRSDIRHSHQTETGVEASTEKKRKNNRLHYFGDELRTASASSCGEIPGTRVTAQKRQKCERHPRTEIPYIERHKYREVNTFIPARGKIRGF